MLHFFVYKFYIGYSFGNFTPEIKFFIRFSQKRIFPWFLLPVFLPSFFWYDRTLENAAENGKVFLFADTLFNNENPHVLCRKCNISVSYVAKKIMDVITKNVSVQGGNRLLKLSLKQGEYLNIGDNIRVVYAGGAGNHIRLLVDAPRDVNIARNKTETNPERRKDTYYAEPGISREAQAEIKKILWNERMKAEAKRDAEKMKE